eukprot:m.221170 g.221170  ORF g.221170 m.221170 type:complete len:520 (-) comp33339_c0_seq1:324-1883(-)
MEFSMKQGRWVLVGLVAAYVVVAVSQAEMVSEELNSSADVIDSVVFQPKAVSPTSFNQVVSAMVAALGASYTVMGAFVTVFSALAVLCMSTTVVAIVGASIYLSSEQKTSVGEAINSLLQFWRVLYYFIVQDGSFEECPYFKDSLHTQCHLYSLSLIFYLWDRPHYRNGTFQDDMNKNLRDVAIPGTGLPLSFVSATKIGTYIFIVCVYPLIALVAAINRGRTNVDKVSAVFTEQLLAPQDWFSYWRLNCRLATLHASLTGEKDYELEDKWKFLTVAEERNVAVTPYMKVAGLVCKHRNEEGGLGYECFDNASVGGDWIIQRKLNNGPFLNAMLPDNAPLSTFRIISASRGGLKSDTPDADNVTMDDVQALSCVWRAGRAKAKTDHSAVLFNVDPQSGLIKKGTTNVHWYQRGLSKIFSTPWTSEQNVTHHPDCNVEITGVEIPKMKEMMDFVRDAHLRLIPHVPLCGWDVALTENDGMLLLEGNFSCNFFRGDFDKKAYFEFVSDYFVAMEKRRRVQA